MKEQKLSYFCQMLKELNSTLKGANEGVLQLIIEMLETRSLQELGKTAHIAGLRAKSVGDYEQDWAWSPRLVAHCRNEYRRRLAPDHAKLLRDHVMEWRYDEAKALATMNPQALIVLCDYKNNVWQEDDQIVNESALEHAWRTGDENFIQLFERLGRALPRSAFKNRETLLEASEATGKKIAEALEMYADNKCYRADFIEVWQNAPHWVFGLDTYIYFKKLSSEDANQINMLTDDVRNTTIDVVACSQRPLDGPRGNRGHGCGWGKGCRCCSWLPPLITRMSVLTSHYSRQHWVGEDVVAVAHGSPLSLPV